MSSRGLGGSPTIIDNKKKGMIACLQHSNLTILNLGNLTTFNLSIFNKNLAIQKFSNFSVFNIGNFHFLLFSSKIKGGNLNFTL